jgi:recombination protein RecR
VSAVLPRAVGRLIEALSRLPGIGPKTASRLTYHLLRASEGESQELAEALRSMRAETKLCSVCFNITDRVVDPCGVCRDDSRRSDLICVVESPLDVLALERTESFRGRYHVLHGAISPVEGVGPDDLKLGELVARIAVGGVDEVILATNPTLEGEATAMYLRRRLEAFPVRVTRLARGLPAGGDLEYADASTLSQALDGRREMP